MDRRIGQLLSLDGRIALVTGAATGIGEAIARTLVSAGASVTIGDIDTEGAVRVGDDIEVTVLRDGEPITATVTLVERPADPQPIVEEDPSNDG
jgi:NAD(P)-dependent dehydrogenase (short-subunit alcohol dehydrogenase family)